MTQIVKVKTGSKFEEIASYSRLVMVDNMIYVSNSAGRNPDTQEIPEGVIEQTEQVFNNIERALAAVDATLADVIVSHVFIQNPKDIHDVMAYIGTKFKGVNPVSTATCPPLGSTTYKVEVEVTAYRGASTAYVKEITIS
ncbi:MAG: RidA family protein [Gammaproteobacteria bacterium]|nr:RidA family protein [Gammaproteobacteria bacterium]